MSVNILVPIANGSEDMETVIIVDVLRRAGFDVKTAAENEITTLARGIKILPDILIDDLDDYDEFDGIVLPGGLGGVKRFSDNTQLEKIVKKHFSAGKLIAAVCAAPTLLLDYKILKPGIKVTSHPSMEDKFNSDIYIKEKVVVDGNIITSRGAGTCFEFALAIVEYFSNKALADKIAGDIVWNV